MYELASVASISNPIHFILSRRSERFTNILEIWMFYHLERFGWEVLVKFLARGAFIVPHARAVMIAFAALT